MRDGATKGRREGPGMGGEGLQIGQFAGGRSIMYPDPFLRWWRTSVSPSRRTRRGAARRRYSRRIVVRSSTRRNAEQGHCDLVIRCKGITVCAERFPPCRGYVESSGGSEFIHGDQARAIRIAGVRGDGFKYGIQVGVLQGSSPRVSPGPVPGPPAAPGRAARSAVRSCTRPASGRAECRRASMAAGGRR